MAEPGKLAGWRAPGIDLSACPAPCQLFMWVLGMKLRSQCMCFTNHHPSSKNSINIGKSHVLIRWWASVLVLYLVCINECASFQRTTWLNFFKERAIPRWLIAVHSFISIHMKQQPSMSTVTPFPRQSSWGGCLWWPGRSHWFSALTVDFRQISFASWDLWEIILKFYASLFFIHLVILC